MIERFSHREGHRPTAAQITVREDAPPALRGAIPMIAKEAGMRPSAIRRVICQVLLLPEDLDNWSEYPNIWGEVVQLINDAKWYQVYDIAEALYPEFDITFDSQPQPGDRFQQRLNDFLVENGIGWQLQDGKITRRGSEVFDRSTREVPKRLEESGFQTRSERNARGPEGHFSSSTGRHYWRYSTRHGGTRSNRARGRRTAKSDTGKAHTRAQPTRSA